MRGWRGDADKLTKLHARLFLYSSLQSHSEFSKCTEWTMKRWWELLDVLSPREVVVLVLKEIRELDEGRIGELLNISREMINKNLKTAKKKLLDNLLISPLEEDSR